MNSRMKIFSGCGGHDSVGNNYSIRLADGGQLAGVVAMHSA